MGALRKKGENRLFYLRRQSTIGRSETCDLTLHVSSVSSHHAVVRWNGSYWVVGDLGSRNGTYLNGERLPPSMKAPRRLSVGDELAFAERTEVWTFADDSPPAPLLIPADGGEPILLRAGEIRVFPSEDEPLGCLYSESGVWRFEDLAGRVRELNPGEPFPLGETTFLLHLPGPAPETPPALDPVAELSIANATFVIRVARDEESAALDVSVCGERFCLPGRTHLYLLAFLARQRVAEQQRTVSDSAGQDGWVLVEEACTGLGLGTPEALALLVYRCRKDLEGLGFKDASRVIDRTKKGMIRIGISADRLRIDCE